MAGRQGGLPESDKLNQWLRRKAPDRLRWRWLLIPLILVILVRVGLSWWLQETPSIVTTRPATYRVTNDPDDIMRAKYAQEAQKLAPETQTGEQRPDVALQMAEPGRLRVAAAQISSVFGKPDKNRRKIEAYIRRAAEIGVKIIVFPEAALPGYADFDRWTLWATDPAAALKENDTAFYTSVAAVGEEKDGAEIAFFSKLAAEVKIYIALPYIEKDGALYYSSIAFFGPDGKVLQNYRKRKLWMVADTFWARAAEGEPEVVQTPLGRIALAAGYDMNNTFQTLEAQKTDIILHSAAFFGDNLQKWLDVRYRDLVKKSGAAVVLANWGKTFVPDWGGFGLSRIYDKGGRLMAGQGEEPGEFLVVADLTLIAPVPVITPAPASAVKNPAVPQSPTPVQAAPAAQ